MILAIKHVFYWPSNKILCAFWTKCLSSFLLGDRAPSALFANENQNLLFIVRWSSRILWLAHANDLRCECKELEAKELLRFLLKQFLLELYIDYFAKKTRSSPYRWWKKKERRSGSYVPHRTGLKLCLFCQKLFHSRPLLFSGLVGLDDILTINSLLTVGSIALIIRAQCKSHETAHVFCLSHPRAL